MRNIVLLLLLLCFLSACGDSENLVDTNPTLPDEEVEIEMVDSVALNLINLVHPINSSNFWIKDFTVSMPGFIWGSTYDEESERHDVLFSYDLQTEEVTLYYAPEEIKMNYFQQIEAGQDGKLYMHSTGFKFDVVVVFDRKSNSWSQINIPGLVNGITVDKKNSVLWVAHQEGVSKYANDVLTTYDDTNSALERIRSGSNFSFFGFKLEIDQSGILWYANMTELYIYQEGRWSKHPNSPLSSSYIIWAMVPSESEGVFTLIPETSLYVLNAQGVLRLYEGESDIQFPEDIVLDIQSRISDNSIIYAHNNGLSVYNLDRNELITIDSKNSLLPNTDLSLKLDRDLEGNIWFGGGQVLGIVPEDL